MGKKRGAVEKGGSFRNKRPRPTFKRPFEKAKKGQIPIPPEQTRDVEIDEADMEFVAEYGKELDFLNSLDGGQLDDGVLKKQKGKGEQAVHVKNRKTQGVEDKSESDSDDQVPSYERVPRGRKGEDPDDRPKPAAEEASELLLPIKTPSGDVIFKQEEASLSRKSAEEMAGRVEGIVVEDMAELGKNDDTKGDVLEAEGNQVGNGSIVLEKEEENDEEEEEEAVGNEEELAQGATLMDLQDGQTLEERRQELREQMAKSASRVVNNPEENIGDMKGILAMVKDGDSQIQRLAMVSLLAIFKDICPGYRIRLPTEKEKSVKVSKDVARLQAYEAFLLRCYQVFLKQLIGFQQRKGNSGSPLARVAVRCAGGLLAALNHFNYSSDLLQAVVPHMCDADASIRKTCSDAVAKSIEGDTEGRIAVEAVQLVGDLVKRRKCQCPPELLHSLMGLTFPDINLANDDDEDLKKVKQKRKRSKKKGDDVEKTFRAAEGDPDRERKAALQSQTVEALFEIFFRVLKDCARVTRQPGASTGSLSSNDLQERCPMLYQSLRGLSKYAHVLSVEYFQDLLEVFRQLLASPALPCLERLCCLLTTSDILHGQGEALNVDRRDYYQQLYWSLKHWDPYLCTDDGIEEPDGGIDADHHGWSWEHKKALESIEELEALLVQVINEMLCESKTRDYPRLAAFLKRLLWLGLHQGCSVLMGIQAVVNRLLLRHHRLRSLLDGDGGAPAGGKGYNPQIDDPGEASALSSTLWELTVLAKHFHPDVSQGATDLANIPVDSGRSSAMISSVLSAMDGPSALVNRYNTSRGTFWPVPKAPKKLSKSARRSFAMSETKHFTDLQESCEEEIGDDGLLLEGSLKKFFRENSRFQRNAELRRELAAVKSQAEKFKEHLGSKKSKRK